MRTFDLAPLPVPASVIGLGTMIFHPDTQTRDHGLLDAFVDSGGTYIDTAEVYGAVEEHGYSEMAIDGSLARLKTDCLDIWMFHRDDPSLDVAPLVDALDEEVRSGRIRAWGASNWTTARLEQAADYAERVGKAGPIASSPHFSPARAKEPYWPDTVVTRDVDRDWYAERGLPLVAWSSLGRGFFAHGRKDDESDAVLVRVFYSPDNFERKERLGELAAARDMTIFETALGWVINHPFPVIALCGAQTAAEVRNCTRAGDRELSSEERDWLDLRSNTRPF